MNRKAADQDAFDVRYAPSSGAKADIAGLSRCAKSRHSPDLVIGVSRPREVSLRHAVRHRAGGGSARRPVGASCPPRAIFRAQGR